MIREETSSDLINAIANAPGVVEHVSYIGEVDWTPAVESPDCIVVSNGSDAVGVFEKSADRVFQTHTIFGPTCRGKRAIETGKEMLDYMIPRHAEYIWGYTPLRNAKARWFNRKVGAQVLGEDCLPMDGVVEVFRYPPLQEEG